MTMTVRHISSMRTLTLVFVSLLLPAVSDAVTCYTPDGAVAEGDQPCFPENPVSSCCGGSTYICATNNMCAYNSGDESGSYYVIGSCTDRSWNSPACPGYCYFRECIRFLDRLIFRLMIYLRER